MYGLLMASIVATGASGASVDVKKLWDAPRKDRSKHRSVRKLWEKSSTTASSKSSAERNTLARIHDSQNTLQQTDAQQKQMNQQLEKIARSIEKAELERVAINKVLDRLEREQKQTRSRYDKAKAAIDQYGGKIRTLDTQIQKRHDAYVRLLADQFALMAALEAIDRPSVESVLQQEVYRAVLRKNARDLTQLKRQIDTSLSARNKLKIEQNRIRKSIAAITAKRKLYEKKKAEKDRLLARLAKQEKEYRKQLKAILERQQMLRNTLAKLHILRREEIARAKEEEAKRRAQLKQRTRELDAMRKQQEERARAARKRGETITYTPARIAADSTAPKRVKQYGSSYQADNIQAYRGARTIAPIAHARVIKRFGTYVDPIYKIKIFNDNVVLKAPKSGAKVRNVLNGKVVYIGKNSMLGKVVIIEHGNRLHTIYAALDRISPLLKTGSRVKKGAVIGRIKRKLIFQATQNSKYINPLRLIRL
jgi:murein DD-endopeptidase MepM/ murein hydrolase activator NlpD